MRVKDLVFLFCALHSKSENAVSEKPENPGCCIGHVIKNKHLIFLPQESSLRQADALVIKQVLLKYRGK